jgi:hypothetical protein
LLESTDGMISESNLSYKCKYCQKDFRKESTLVAHSCEQKRRHDQQKETGVQWGLRAYLRFYEYTQGSAKLKSYDDFSRSPYYLAFVKYGRYAVAIRCINFSSFTDFLLKNNKKLDYWCKDSLYDEWLKDYIKKESPQDALERAIKEMTEYAETHPELKNGYREYFKFGNTNRICQHIISGRISPWVIYNCNSGIEYLERLDEHQLEMIMPYLDPDFWQKKFVDYVADAEWTKSVLKEAGL